MPLVTAQELSDYMSGIRMNDAQVRSAESILFGTQQDLENYLHRPLEPKRAREMVRVDRSGYLNVKHTPVTAVIRIQDYGSTLPSRASDIVPNYTPEESSTLPIYDYAPVNNGSDMIVPGGVKYGTPNTYVLIEYVSGGSRLIMDNLYQIKVAIMRVASREFERMHDDTMSLQQDRASSAEASSRLPLGWTPEELARFDRLRRRIMA